MIAYRPATAADLDAYYAGQPYPTMRAVVVTQDGALAGIIGVARHGRCAQFFSEFREGLRPHLKRMAALRAIEHALQFVKDSPLPVYAVAEESEPDAARILARLGFVHEKESLYLWRNSRRSSPT